MCLSHEQGFVEHPCIGVRLRFEQLRHDVVEPPDGVPGDGADGEKEGLVGGDVLPVPAVQGGEGLPHLRRDGQEDGLRDDVHQAGEHPLLELKVLEMLKLFSQLTAHQEIAEDSQMNIVSDTPWGRKQTLVSDIFL